MKSYFGFLSRNMLYQGNRRFTLDKPSPQSLPKGRGVVTCLTDI